jgi:type IV fimbrial biogenesis protein FimT
MCCDRPAKGSGGFTMIELLVVITIAAVLAGIAAPAFNSLINSTRLTSIASRLATDLSLARGEAIKRNMRVLACVRNAGGTDCGTSTDWAAGWLVCYDNDTGTSGNGVSDGRCDEGDSANPNPILLQEAVGDGIAVTTSVASIRFNPNGSQGAPSTGSVVSMVISRTASTTATRTISVAVTGNISKTSSTP